MGSESVIDREANITKVVAGKVNLADPGDSIAERVKAFFNKHLEGQIAEVKHEVCTRRRELVAAVLKKEKMEELNALVEQGGNSPGVHIDPKVEMEIQKEGRSALDAAQCAAERYAESVEWLATLGDRYSRGVAFPTDVVKEEETANGE